MDMRSPRATRAPRATVVGFAALLASGCTPAPPPTVMPRETTAAVVTPHVSALVDTARWVDSTLATLTARQRVAQMVMFWMVGDYTSADDTTFAENVSWVEHEGAGGITMSLGTPIEVADKLNYLQRRARVPLIVASDLEPSLMRLEGAVFTHYLMETGGATSFPTAMAIAATARDSDAYDVGRAIAEEARASGIHVNFAPVVDVNINPNNPVIGTRSFGEDPSRVARLSALFVAGTHAGGALATAKHFPGHGDTDVDSHVGLPVVKADMPRLQRVELRPFEAAIGAGAELVMSAHIALPALGGDSATPATLRPDVMHDLLRDSLGFHGVAITDALSMAGVGRGYSVEETVVGAIKAGADILLRPAAGDARPNEVVRAIDAVMAAEERGDLTAARIDSSVQRILWMKARAGLATRREVSLDSLRLVVGSAAHRALAQDVAQRSITLLRDSSSALPIAAGAKIAVVSYMPETELKAGKAFAKELRTLRPDARVVAKIGPATPRIQLDSIARALKGSDAILLAMYVRRVEGEGRTTVPVPVASWIDSVAASTKGAIVLAFGNPYLLRQFPHARAYLNTYTVGDPSEIAAARAVLGARPIRGRSPVSLPGFFTAGDGIDR
jgi:beta-N-acetylhexosaminidase